MYLACHAPIMDNPENNQHFSVLIYRGEGGLRISTLCTIEKMLTIIYCERPLNLTFMNLYFRTRILIVIDSCQVSILRDTHSG